MTNESADALAPHVILSQTAFFGDLSALQLERVAALSEIQECEEGRQVYRIGDSGAKATWSERPLVAPPPGKS